MKILETLNPNKKTTHPTKTTKTLAEISRFNPLLHQRRLLASHIRPAPMGRTGAVGRLGGCPRNSSAFSILKRRPWGGFGSDFYDNM